MRKTRPFLAIVAMLAAAGCSAGPSADGTNTNGAMLTGPTPVSADSSSPGTVKSALTGPAIDRAVPEGQALADESRFTSGGETFLTVQVKKVNLPDGTRLDVSLDFKPLGSIRLAQGAGNLTVSLGHFAVSRDQVVVKNGSVTVLEGFSFK